MPSASTAISLVLVAGTVLVSGCSKQSTPTTGAETEEQAPEPQPVVEVAVVEVAVVEVAGVEVAVEEAAEDSVTEVLPPPASTEPTGPLECDSTYGIDDKPAGGCVTDTLRCGESIRGHTQGGGGNRFDASYYQSKFCMVTSETYNGEERIYRFSMPPTTQATVELNSPCADLDLFVLQWSQDECPSRGSSITTCDATTRAGGGKVELDSIRYTRRFLLVVEGKGDVNAPFELSASCNTRE